MGWSPNVNQLVVVPAVPLQVGAVLIAPRAGVLLVLCLKVVGFWCGR